MNRGQSYVLGVGLTAAGLIGFGAVAQDSGGLRATFGISQSIEASDNFDLSAEGSEQSGTRAVTNLSLGVSSATDSTSLSFNANGKLEAGSGAESGLVDPTARLSFSTSSRNTRFQLRGRYAETDVNTVTFEGPSALDLQLSALGIGSGEGELVLGDGTRINTGLGFSYETGREDPVSFSLSTDYSHTGYRGVTDPDLFEFESLSTTVSTRLRLSEVANLRLGTTVLDYEAEDANATRRDNIRYFANLGYRLRPDLSADLSVNYSDNETRTTGGVDVDEGFGLGFGLTKTLSNGSVKLTFDSSVNSDGRSNTLRVSRAMNLPDGALSVSLGAVDTPNSGVSPLVDINYSKNLKRGQVSLGLSQRVSVNSDDDTIINTRLNAGYSAEINSRSGWGVNLGLADTDTVSVDDDSRRVNLGLSYRHAVSRDWNMVARYDHATSKRSNGDDRSSNTVSLRLQRSFEFRP